MPYSKLIDELSPDKLKEEVDMEDETTGEKCYDMLSVEDYKNILNYMNIKNCKLYIEYLMTMLRLIYIGNLLFCY